MDNLKITDRKKYISASLHPSGEYCFTYSIYDVRCSTVLSVKGKLFSLYTRRVMPILGACDPVEANNFETFYRSETLSKKEYDKLVIEAKLLLTEHFTADQDIGGATSHYKPL